jgi:hypothetical protein
LKQALQAAMDELAKEKGKSQARLEKRSKGVAWDIEMSYSKDFGLIKMGNRIWSPCHCITSLSLI